MTMMLPLEITAPTIEFRQLAPILILFGAACAGVLVDALMLGRSRRWRGEVQIGLVVGGVLAALAYTVANLRLGPVGAVAMGSIMLDGPTAVMWVLLLVFGLLAVMVFKEERLAGVPVFASSAATVPGSREEAEADRFVLARGLGPVLAGLLRRFGHPMTLERMRQLEAAVEQPQRPRLHLVHG